MTQKVHRSFVLHSGGIDSSTALAVAIAAAEEQDDVEAISIYYGQRHRKELEYAERFCGEMGVKHTVIHMAEPPSSMLTDESRDIPKMSYADLPTGMSPTYVPFRNGQLLSRIAGIAQGWIMKQEEAHRYEDPPIHGSATADIWFGAHAEDAQNWAYPDCTPEFVGAMAAAIYIGTYHKVRLITPFIHLTKNEIVDIGFHYHNVDYSVTWSCYAGGEKHCGECPTCIARKEAFIKAGVPDPTDYLA
jgi:7-cyano-7-deazaguanine synthase